jgi:hypothetical protein
MIYIIELRLDAIIKNHRIINTIDEDEYYIYEIISIILKKICMKVI